MFRIVEKALLTPGIYSIKVRAPRVAVKAKPGHFVIIRLHDAGERIPLTVVGTDPQAGLVWLIFQAMGKSTTELASYEAGQDIADLVGPLGHAEPLGKVGTMLVIGGGVGTAPILPRAIEAKTAGSTVLGIVGSRSKDLMILGPELAAACDKVYYCTDDGSFGHHGLVTEMIPVALEEFGRIDQALAIGPVPMMRACVKVCTELGIPVTVSLNAMMVDGTGMCGACRVTVGGETKFTCVDGPEFDGAEVDFAELSARLRQYSDQEKAALASYQDRERGGCQCQHA